MKSTRMCENGHRYSKSSDCPTCPVCESNRKPADGILSRLAAPARRALERLGIQRVEQLAAFKEEEIRNLHGIGPNAMTTLSEAGVKFNGQN
jgi:predicted RecB family nuclease